jgi:hypothetical protein
MRKSGIVLFSLWQTAYQICPGKWQRVEVILLLGNEQLPSNGSFMAYQKILKGFEVLCLVLTILSLPWL